ncbi:unnamed protein product [Phytomonas sp. Hart1]|nr:unnamed protein product [Phytomonas sp. Hart1]|eukprot:CCW71940.1 unnamed protein product [Phytomonas sp. isolate Hart1]
MQDAIPEEEEEVEELLASKSHNKSIAMVKETSLSSQIVNKNSFIDGIDDSDLGFSYVSPSQRSTLPRKSISNDPPALAVGSSKVIKHSFGDDLEIKSETMMDADEFGEIPDDTDYPNDEKEYNAWKERYIQRKQAFYGLTENKEGELPVLKSP